MNSIKDKVAVSTDATYVILGASGNTGSQDVFAPAYHGKASAA
jgi:hypothetical protein